MSVMRTNGVPQGLAPWAGQVSLVSCRLCMLLQMYRRALQRLAYSAGGQRGQ